MRYSSLLLALHHGVLSGGTAAANVPRHNAAKRINRSTYSVPTNYDICSLSRIYELGFGGKSWELDHIAGTFRSS